MERRVKVRNLVEEVVLEGERTRKWQRGAGLNKSRDSLPAGRNCVCVRGNTSLFTPVITAYTHPPYCYCSLVNELCFGRRERDTHTA